MARSSIWYVVVFTVFAFATVLVFFWIRDGSLGAAGDSMDSLLGKTGATVAKTADDIVANTGQVINNATDGDKRT
ncbi:MAG: hypothetical protein ABMA14_27050 [Hyphomonadaceae bacterium]